MSMKSVRKVTAVVCASVMALYTPISVAQSFENMKQDVARISFNEPLVDMLSGLDFVSSVRGNVFRFTMPDGMRIEATNVDEFLTGEGQKGVSLDAVFSDNAGQVISEITLNRGIIVDRNRVDMESVITIEGMDYSSSISMTGLLNHSAMLTMNLDDNVSQIYKVDYRSFAPKHIRTESRRSKGVVSEGIQVTPLVTNIPVDDGGTRVALWVPVIIAVGAGGILGLVVIAIMCWFLCWNTAPANRERLALSQPEFVPVA